MPVRRKGRGAERGEGNSGRDHTRTVYLTEFMAMSPGMRLGPYELTASIGAGGMGEVWKAYDPKLQRTVAIKALRDQSADASRPHSGGSPHRLATRPSTHLHGP